VREGSHEPEGMNASAYGQVMEGVSVGSLLEKGHYAETGAMESLAAPEGVFETRTKV
jgi:hypothetical protein